MTEKPAENTDYVMHRRRLKRMQITLDAVLSLAIAHTKGKLPRDAKPMGAYFDFNTQSFWVIVSSSKFNIVKEADEIPELPV
jgi:hypothetical protein